MLDRYLRPLIDPPLNRLGRGLAWAGIGANAVTLAGLLLGLGAAGAIAWGAPLVALGLILASRLADGLDGAVARATRLSDLGGFLDIVADFVFYAAVVLGLCPPNAFAGGFFCHRSGGESGVCGVGCSRRNPDSARIRAAVDSVVVSHVAGFFGAAGRF